MNIQHSSRSDSWMTPIDIIEKARAVLGGIDLDPASTEYANQFVQATEFFTETMDGLSLPWHGRVFLNPPGGKLRNKSKTALFWIKLMEEHAKGNVEAAIFLAFSAEALQNTQGKGVPSIGEHMFCIPAKRLHFVSPPGVMQKDAPSHSNVIVCVGDHDLKVRFIEEFRDVGVIC